MREGWETKSLGDVCCIEKAKYQGSNLPFVGLEDIEGGTGRFLGELSPKSVESGSFHFTPDHLLFGRLRPYLNKVLKPDFEGHCSSEIFPIRPLPAIDRSFLQYWLMSGPVVREIDRTSTGARMPRANVNAVLDFDAPLPPLPEQKRIVAVLDEAFQGIDRAVANTEKNLANARELFESQLNAVFFANDARQQALVDVTTKIGSGATPKGGQKSYKETGTPLVRSLNVHDSEFRDKNLAFIDDVQASKLNNVIVAQGDVFLNITGASIARCCIAPNSLAGARVNQHVAIIRPMQQRLVPKFLEYILISPAVKDDLLGIGEKAGATRQALTKSQLQSFRIPLPTLPEQKRIVAILDELKANSTGLVCAARRKLDLLAGLKQSIPHKAFAGELTADRAEPVLAEAGA